MAPKRNNPGPQRVKYSVEEGTEHFDRERVPESQSVDVLDIVVDSELMY